MTAILIAYLASCAVAFGWALGWMQALALPDEPADAWVAEIKIAAAFALVWPLALVCYVWWECRGRLPVRPKRR